MLARCAAKILTASNGDDVLQDACQRLSLDYSRIDTNQSHVPSKEQPTEGDLSVRGALDILSSIMRRADADPSERRGGASAAIWFVSFVLRA